MFLDREERTMWGFGISRLRRHGSPRAQNEDAPPGCFLMIVVPVLFFISTYFAWEELWYIVLGTTATANVDRVIETQESYRRSYRRKLYGVTYSFEDRATGEARTERDDVPRSWPKPQGTVEIVYIPNNPDWSRIAGHRNYYSVAFFFVCVVVAAVYGTSLIREARQAVSESQAHEVRRRRRGE
jgi:hypothetical protein